MSPLRKILRRLAIALGEQLYAARSSIAARTLPAFATRPRGLVVDLPREIENPDRIVLGDDVKLGPNSVLRAKTRSPGTWLAHPDGDHVEQSFEPRLELGHRVTATSGLQVVAYERVTIGDDVTFAANVYVSDGSHATPRGDRPYKYQGIDPVAPVAIGRGSWIGQNAVILPGVSVGEYAVVGANSVVASDVPDGGVVVGSPARLVKRWDPSSERWERRSRPETRPETPAPTPTPRTDAPAAEEEHA